MWFSKFLTNALISRNSRHKQCSVSLNISTWNLNFHFICLYRWFFHCSLFSKLFSKEVFSPLSWHCDWFYCRNFYAFHSCFYLGFIVIFYTTSLKYTNICFFGYFYYKNITFNRHSIIVLNRFSINIDPSSHITTIYSTLHRWFLDSINTCEDKNS